MDHTTILAIDLGKFNSILCWFEPETRSAALRTVRTGDAELRARTAPPTGRPGRVRSLPSGGMGSRPLRRSEIPCARGGHDWRSVAVGAHQAQDRP